MIMKKNLMVNVQKMGVNQVEVDGKMCFDMGTCDYLDLVHDKRVQEKIIEAIRIEGNYYASTAFVSRPARVARLESRFEKIFQGSKVLFTSTTTLGSVQFFKTVGNLPGTAILIDHKAHASLQFTAMAQCRSPKFRVKHFDIADLERRVSEIHDKFDIIWFASDSVLSESGLKVDCQGLVRLQRKFPKLHFYLDDCHGGAIYGANGEGWAVHGLKQAGYDPTRYAIIYSFNKAWGCGPGAVLAIPNETMLQAAILGPTPYMFSGQISNLTLAGVEACLDIFEDASEVKRMQDALFDNAQYLRQSLKRNGYNINTEHTGTSLFLSISRMIDTSEMSLVQATMRFSQLASGLIDNGFHTAVFGPPATQEYPGIRIFIRRSMPKESLDKFVSTLNSLTGRNQKAGGRPPVKSLCSLESLTGRNQIARGIPQLTMDRIPSDHCLAA